MSSKVSLKFLHLYQQNKIIKHLLLPSVLQRPPSLFERDNFLTTKVLYLEIVDQLRFKQNILYSLTLEYLITFQRTHMNL